ncbi:MAG TPA: hypothetical protein VM866_06510 [Pyrinomonadaceae bacterium]|jgi:hypothetical protein|nr:hypothetical protein [Pyrinomonadaceae bacterium]
MFGKKKHRGLDEQLDRLGRELVRTSANNETEVESAAASPFLYARVRARIAAERRRREAGENWLSLLTVARRAVPAMALSAAIAFGVFQFGGNNQFEQSFDDDDVLFAANDTGVGRVVFDDTDALSNDEMLDTIMSGNGEAEASR